MLRFVLFFLSILFIPASISANTLRKPEQPIGETLKRQLLGTPVYIQVFKEERQLELYGKIGTQFYLFKRYPICNFSGGLGPKMRAGDFKSPEGFYRVGLKQLKRNSRYYRAINLGFPNQYDREHGYSGDYLMIHGSCVSVGCYAMTDSGMDDIYTYVDAALRNGQPEVNISIYPFRPTPENLARHRNSVHIAFWHELQPGYDWFQRYKQPPEMMISGGQYQLVKNAVNPPAANAARTFLALSTSK